MAKIAGSNLTKVKRQNMRYIKEIIYRYGPISRSRIAEMLTLTPPTITTNVAELISAGLVREVSLDAERETGALGRKPAPLDFVPNTLFFLGVEITPMDIFASVTDLRGHEIAASRTPNTNPVYEDVLVLLTQIVETLIKKSAVPPEQLVGMGIGVPGFVKGSQGVVRSFRRFRWKDRALARDMAARTGIRTYVDNNVRMRAIGKDLSWGEGRPENFAYFFVSHGIACPMMIQNSMFSGQTAGAGEVGHMVVQIDGAPCASCGNHGCLDAYSSDTAVTQQCADALREGKTGPHFSVQDPEKPSIEEILAAQALGDAAITHIVRHAIRYLAVALANLINFMSPQMVIVDAKLMQLPQNRDVFVRQVKQNLYGLNDTEVLIEFKGRDLFDGARGAAASAIKEFFIKDD